MAGKQQILWNDGDRLFCRLRRPDGSSVLVIRPVNEQPLPATVDRLTHEYLLREQLDASWALLPQALERINGKPRLVLGDPGGQPLSALLVSPLDIETCLRLAVEISVALGRLHLAGLVHTGRITYEAGLEHCTDRNDFETLVGSNVTRTTSRWQ